MRAVLSVISRYQKVFDSRTIKDLDQEVEMFISFLGSGLSGGPQLLSLAMSRDILAELE